MKPVVKALPQYDFIYLGDTLNLPYGDKKQNEIYRFTRQALDFLFAKDCAIVFLFCNTASASALRKLQHEGYKALGIIIPTIEEASGKRIGLLATQSTVDSGKYIVEINKILPNAKVFQLAAPKLVPMIESGMIDRPIIYKYSEFIMKQNIDTLILGCTHYGAIKKYLPKHIKIISQEDIIAPKVADYLRRHPEIESRLSRTGSREYFVTADHPRFDNFRDFDSSVFRLIIL